MMPQGHTSTLRARGTPEVGGDGGPEPCGCLLPGAIISCWAEASGGPGCRLGQGQEMYGIRSTNYFSVLPLPVSHCLPFAPLPMPPGSSSSDLEEGLLSQCGVLCTLQQPQAIVLPNNSSSLSLLGELLTTGKLSLALWLVISLHASP